MSERAYKRLIEECIHTVINQGAQSFTDVCRACKGAFPLEVYEAVKRLHLESHPSIAEINLDLKVDNFVIEDFQPEPSPINFEWRFTYNTAKKLSDYVKSFGNRVLCIGTPSVFRFLISQGVDAQLIDCNKFLLHTYPSSIANRIYTKSIEEIGKSESINSAFFDTIIMDPPWYVDQIINWVKIARKLIKQHGTIVLTLFPELVRPSAILDRAEVFAFLDKIGTVKKIESIVEYEIPVFERETISALNLPVIGNWRLGDLITLNPNSDNPLLSSTTFTQINEEWNHFRFGQQLVGVKTKIINDRIKVESPLKDGSFLLKSVSAREVVRNNISFWTSRNRVALVTNTEKVCDFLTKLDQGNQPESLINSIAIDDEEKTSLKILLALIGW